MSETVSLIIMLMTLTATFFTKISASDDFQLTKLVKRPNENLDLHCSLKTNHEKFNRNSTRVSWWYLKNCNLCALNAQSLEHEEWELIDCEGVTLTLNNSLNRPGFYMCKIFPYHVTADQTLQIEIVKTFEIEIAGRSSPPEIIYDTPNNLNVPINTTVVLQCKCHSIKQIPKIQWFKQIIPNENQEHEEQGELNFREINFLENSYRPVASSGLKKLDEDIYLSKLIVNNLTEDAIYACAVINYYGYKYRNFVITVQKSVPHMNDEEEEEGEEDEEIFMSEEENSSLKQNGKSLELFFIPLFLLLLIVAIQVSSILYLLVYRSIMREANKNIV